MSMIRVTVCVPDSSLRREMKVSPNMTINRLKKYLPNPNCNLVFGGSYLLEDHPLNFYSVSDGDFLIAVSKKSEDMVFQKFTENYDEFVQKMKVLINPKLSGTVAKLRDLRMQKLENCTKFPRIYEIEQETTTIPTFVDERNDGQLPEKPSDEPLPVLWDIKQNEDDNMLEL
ncbi:hypothetical protein TRFO_15666 [Tritrichomonas foetus]|uniref:Ubiquitin-like domain-containing protein n=1 Tax=Tritrichomonas foetus TaxID=1144522 RepID=A0A1J4KRV0_9EUKA|nr:hypothetical protein TRFO_15666 [Tritrichomonas foetus]|eukprot:OHT14017.1 hypothetical protein TRFO_15666 [Tritrichomonas foetus]